MVEIGVETGMESVLFFFFGGCCGQCLGLVVVWFLGLVVAWWLVCFGCCGGFLVVLVVAEAVAIVFDGCLVHLDMGWWVLIRV